VLPGEHGDGSDRLAVAYGSRRASGSWIMASRRGRSTDCPTGRLRWLASRVMMIDEDLLRRAAGWAGRSARVRPAGRGDHDRECAAGAGP
jgi:hypothetical protein